MTRDSEHRPNLRVIQGGSAIADALFEARRVAARVCCRMLRHSDQEEVLAAWIDSEGDLGEIARVARGAAVAGIIAADLFPTKIEARHAHLVLATNHPDGDVTPREADIALTRQLAKVSTLLRINILDHVIVARGGGWASMRDYCGAQLFRGSQ